MSQRYPYIGRTDEHPDFYAEPEYEPTREELHAEAVAEYVRWFGDETEQGDRRLMEALNL